MARYRDAHVGPLAYAPPPLEDEPLDGYLEYLAHRLRLPSTVLHAHLGVRPDSAFGLARELSRTQARGLAAATDLTPERLHSMTLRRYADIGLLPAKREQGGGPGPWLRRRGARFCPRCLRERDMRWRLSWYLQWTFICPDHAVLLDACCPACGRPARTRISGHPIAGTTGAAQSQIDDGGPSRRCPCAVQTLAAADELRTAEHSVLDRPVPAVYVRAQQAIAERIEGRGGVHYLGFDRSNTEWIHDLAALCRLLVVNMPTDRITAAYRDVLATEGESTPIGQNQDPVGESLGLWVDHLGLSPFTSPAARFAEAGASRVTFALVATVATTILNVPGLATAARLLASVLPAGVRKDAARLSRARGISWPLARALWLVEHPAQPAQTRAIRLGSDRFRPDGSPRVPLDRSRIPVRPWSSVRAELAWSGQNPFTGLATTVGLLTIATPLPLRVACEHLDHAHLANRVAHETRKLFAALATTTEPDIFDDLLRIHDAISTGLVPIDYVRRRRVFPRPTSLAQRTATKTARELGQRPTPRLARFMSWWIYEQLTGNDVLLRPELLDLPGAIRWFYARQRDTWDPEPPARLLRQAEHALMVNRIDEPITWTPTVTSDGTWTCLPALMDRQLDWSQSTSRESSKPTETSIEHLGLQEVVALAGSGQSPRSDRLAIMLARFEAVTVHGTVTGAADQLGIAQPTLSITMRSLERELGKALLHRSHHAITLTDQGQALRHALQHRPLAHVNAGQRLDHPLGATRPTREDHCP